MRNIRPRVFSSSSSSSSRSYSSSSSPLFPRAPSTRTREEVWRDVTFHPPPPPPPLNPNPNPNPRSSHFILQDFLAGPFKGKTHTSSSLSAADHHNEEEELPFPRPPPTALSLNSTLNFHYDPIPSATPNCSGRDRISDGGAVNVAPDFAHLSVFSDSAAIGSPPTVGMFSFCANNKRLLESSCSFGGGGGGGDPRNKRMMKNRESAARSRARKQAYTNELELEVAHLVAENAKLRKQYEELRLVMAAQHSTKKILQRTSTAPF